MHGIGAASVRDLFAEYGSPGLICAPFLRVTAQPPSLGWFREQVHRSMDVPLSVQLLGSHPDHLASVARCLADAGVDVVDLNLGCPARTVVRRGAGAALLSDLEAIRRLVSVVRAGFTGRLSVKFRSGDASADGVVPIAQAIEASGADFLVLHPRTRLAGYSGVADWELVKLVKASVRIPVVGNGDCWYAKDALRLQTSSGADAVMIGRPSLRNPFIFRQLAELRAKQVPFHPSPADVFGHVRRLADIFRVELSHTRSGPAGALKEHLQFLLRAVPAPTRQALWTRAANAQEISDVVEAMRPLLDLEGLDLGADGPMRLEQTPNAPSNAWALAVRQ